MSDVDRTGLAARLAAHLDTARDEPLSHQIADQVWLEVIEGTLETGERLPTVRQLAVALGASPRTVERAYAELERLGVVSTRVGQGTFVSLGPPAESVRERRRELLRLCLEALERADALGFDAEDLIDTLGELRAARLDAEPSKTPPGS
ncbi:MAG: GntR family transcriptional regulator [Gemmatimonadetes bacterium]|nr:GntR family transcriptional regulator [Gemmatimonadota bacterium]